MEKLCLMIVFSLCFFQLWGQNTEKSDTVAQTKNLDEVTVYGEDVKLAVGEVTFIPTGREKKAASGGYHLLRMMNMPQIDVDASGKSVKTISGMDVAIYVNGIEAGPNEIAGILCTDVKKVVYMEMPTDPRYGAKRYVIDIILVKYEYGGYTKLATEQKVPEITGNVTGYSKIAYKSMTYDLNAGYGYYDKKHGGYSQDEMFPLTSDGVSRISTPIHFRGGPDSHMAVGYS